MELQCPKGNCLLLVRKEDHRQQICAVWEAHLCKEGGFILSFFSFSFFPSLLLNYLYMLPPQPSSELPPQALTAFVQVSLSSPLKFASVHGVSNHFFDRFPHLQK